MAKREPGSKAKSAARGKKRGSGESGRKKAEAGRKRGGAKMAPGEPAYPQPGEDGAESADAPPGLDPAFRDLVFQVAGACGWRAVDLDDDIILLQLETADGERTQKVSILADRDLGGQTIARYWTVIGPADGIDPAHCLEVNATLAYGALATHRGKLVMMDTQLVADADPLEVGTAIAAMAAYADRWEERLFRRDVY